MYATGLPHFTALCFILLQKVLDFFFFFLQTEGKTLHQQNDYSWLYCDTCFVRVVWDQACDILEGCLYLRFNPNALNLCFGVENGIDYARKRQRR